MSRWMVPQNFMDLKQGITTSGSNLVILAWTGDELWWEQPQNSVNFDFKFNLALKFKVNCRQSNRDLKEDVSPLWARFLSHILSQVTWQVTWPRLRSQVTCGVFCLWFLKWLHKSLGPKSLGLFWNAPYCFPSDALLTSPCISVNIIVTSRVNSIVTSLNAAP